MTEGWTKDEAVRQLQAYSAELRKGADALQGYLTECETAYADLLRAFDVPDGTALWTGPEWQGGSDGE